MAFQTFQNVPSAGNFSILIICLVGLTEFSTGSPAGRKGDMALDAFLFLPHPQASFVWGAVPVLFWTCYTLCYTALSISLSSTTKDNGAWGRAGSCLLKLLIKAAYYYNKYVWFFLFSSLSLLHKQDWFVFMPSLTFTLVKCSGQVFFNLKGNLYIEKMTRYM